jgi:hypothetical protein
MNNMRFALRQNMAAAPREYKARAGSRNEA